MNVTSSTRRMVKSTIGGVSAAAIRMMSRDVTDELSRRSCLVVAPHPDDETLGCGATIARMCALGTDVRIVFVTGGEKSPLPPSVSAEEIVGLRRTEAGRAAAALGLAADAVVHWEFPDGAVDHHVRQLTDDLARLLTATPVEQVLVTSAHDRHPDHAATAVATRAAVALVDPVPALFEFPIWQRLPAWTVVRGLVRSRFTGAQTASEARRPRLVRVDQFAVSKDAAMRAYESQLPHFPEGFLRDFRRSREVFWPAPPM